MGGALASAVVKPSSSGIRKREAELELFFFGFGLV